MTPEKLMRLRLLQERERNYGLNPSEQDELDALRRELAMAPEVADDPRTLFTDESRRPLLDGTDYLAVQRQRDCDEARAWLEAFVLRVGREAAEAAVTAAMRSIRR